MAKIDFASLLSPEQKRSLLTARIEAFAADGYQHSLNKKAYEAAGDTAGVEAADAAMATISAAIEAHQEELDSLPAVVTE